MDKFLEYFKTGQTLPLYYTIKFAIIVVIVVIVVNVINAVMRHMTDRAQQKGKQAGYIQLLRYALLTMTYVIGIMTALTDFPTVKTILSQVLAGSGVVAIILSIAFQEPIGNLCSGVMIFFAKPFQVGDTIRYIDKDIAGVVEEITMRHIVIRTFENKRLIIPNAIINRSAIENADYSDTKICMMLDFDVTYDSDITLAMQIISDVVLLHPDYCDVRHPEDITAGKAPVQVLVIRFDESAVVIRAWIWARSMDVSLEMKSDILLGIHHRFKEAGIKFAYPHLTIEDGRK